MRSMFRLSLLCLALLSLVLPSTASAQENLDVTKFRPSPHSHDILTVHLTDVPNGFSVGGKVLVHYGKNPLVFVGRDAANNRLKQNVIDDRLTLDLMGNLTFLDRFSVGVLVPVALMNTHQATPTIYPGPVSDGAGLGDISASFKATLLKRDGDGVGLGLVVGGKFPTGKENAFLRDDGIGILPALIVDGAVGDWRIALNAGVNIRTEPFDKLSNDFQVGHEIDLRLGTEVPLGTEHFRALAQVAATSDIGDFFGESNTRYIEADGGLRYVHGSGFTALLGAGTSLTKGYGNVNLRLFGGLGFEPPLTPPDTDQDGINDEQDACPTEAEDFDQFEDTDGCPERDNDRDGIDDIDDACPIDAEDVDGFEDRDGCPDPDNDADGVSDDADGCPMEAEDIDKFQDEDGCPDPDNDGDGIIDTTDACPNEAETVNGFQDEDGCPDVAPRVEIKEDKIVIREKIFFKTNSAKIKEQSFSILDEIVKVLTEHPHISKIRIEGHTDNVGKRKYNIRLSKKRAASVVKYFTKAGIDKKRLSSQGYGPDKPISNNDTDGGRAMNRRVEFTILEQLPKQ